MPQRFSLCHGRISPARFLTGHKAVYNPKIPLGQGFSLTVLNSSEGRKVLRAAGYIQNLEGEASYLWSLVHFIAQSPPLNGFVAFSRHMLSIL